MESVRLWRMGEGRMINGVGETVVIGAGWMDEPSGKAVECGMSSFVSAVVSAPQASAQHWPKLMHQQESTVSLVYLYVSVLIMVQTKNLLAAQCQLSSSN